MLTILYVIIVLLFHDGRQENLSGIPVAVPENADTQLFCEEAAFTEAKRVMALSDQSKDPDSKIEKFDFLCVQAPDWDANPTATETLKDLEDTLNKKEKD